MSPTTSVAGKTAVQYTRCAADPVFARAREPHVALFRPLFPTAFLLDDFLAEPVGVVREHDPHGPLCGISDKGRSVTHSSVSDPHRVATAVDTGGGTADPLPCCRIRSPYRLSTCKPL